MKNPTKEQQAKWNKAWYEKNKQVRRDWNNKQIEKGREYIAEYKATHPCTKCNESDPACLCFHHLRDKTFAVAESVRSGYSTKRIQEEIDKCIVLCANCHLKHHAQERLDLGQ